VSYYKKKAIFSLVDENIVFVACPCEPDQNKSKKREGEHITETMGVASRGR
jgi:hypothetical protein